MIEIIKNGKTMKILHVEAEFIPGLGYQVNLLSKYMKNLGHEVIILSTELDVVRPHQKTYIVGNSDKDNNYFKSSGIKILRVPCKGILSDRHIWSFKVFDKIKEINPDIIFLHDNDTLVSIIYLMFYLKKHQIPLITDSHMVAIASRNKFAKLFQFLYRKIVTPIIIRNNINVVRTVDDDYILKVFNIPENIAPVISFGSDVEKFRPNDIRKKQLRIKYGIPLENRVFIYTGKLSRDKEGLFLANSLLDPFILNINSNISFLIVSSVNGEYGKKVEETFNKSSNTIIRMPFVDHEELADVILTADVAIIHYAASLTYFDYLASGLPVIWSDIEINVRRSNERFVNLFENLSVKSLRHNIEYFIGIDDEELSIKSKMARDYAVDNYSYENITNQFMNVLKTEVDYRKYNPFR
jgi:glycosyltransferase involved in cell wall biosynthesis